MAQKRKVGCLYCGLVIDLEDADYRRCPCGGWLGTGPAEEVVASLWKILEREYSLTPASPSQVLDAWEIRAAGTGAAYRWAGKPCPVASVADREMVSAEVFARRMGVCLETVRRWCRDGHVGAKKLGGRWYLSRREYKPPVEILRHPGGWVWEKGRWERKRGVVPGTAKARHKGEQLRKAKVRARLARRPLKDGVGPSCGDGRVSSTEPMEGITNGGAVVE